MKKKNQQLTTQKAELSKTRVSAKKIRSRLAERLTRNISINVGSLAAEAIPWIGITTIVGVTLMDVNDACNTMNDINELLTILGEEPDESTTKEVCAYHDQIPTVGELKETFGNWF